MRIEDVEYKDQLTIKIYDLKKESVKQILISQELYDEVVDYKNELTATNKSYIDKRHTKISNWLWTFYVLWF